MAQYNNKCGRDARRVLTLLSSVCDSNNIEFDNSPMQGYMADMLMMMYYPLPIINIIKGHILKMKNLQTKHMTVEYWLPMIMNMQKGISLKSAIRPDRQIPDWEENPIIEIPVNRYDYITKHLLVDYGYDDMMVLHRIVNTVDDKIIEHACATSFQNDVYDIRYINVIIQKELALQEMKQNKIQQIWDRSNRVQHEEIHQHSILDMAQVEYNWKKAQEDAEIERMWRDKFETL